MATTQLFVELLVIGFGVTAWLVLFVAAALGWQPSQFSQHLGGVALVPLSALAYVLGIIVDRIARELFARVSGTALAHPPGTPVADAELLICEKSERLWNSCAYNRSRFRICRAWTLNFAMIAVAYATWNARVRIHDWRHSAAVTALAFLCSLLAAWATARLNRDYNSQVGKVFRFLSDRQGNRIPRSTLCSRPRLGRQ
ncbi:MAG TPA: hypothetical protein VMU45_09560 [Candidatus Eisenbacteria bacterium]|nr:hypothetical protein [Candidatus Eisenbacteria bacterium]